MPGLIGKKIGMTTIFSEAGKNIPCTILEVGPCKVVQIKTEEVDGYNAVQLGFSEQKESRVSKAALGHFKKADSTPLRKLVEFQILDQNALHYGIDLSELMDNAGAGIADYICQNFKGRTKIAFALDNSLKTETSPSGGLTLENLVRTLLLTHLTINPELFH